MCRTLQTVLRSRHVRMLHSLAATEPEPSPPVILQILTGRLTCLW
jgi:hypothetical protein